MTTPVSPVSSVANVSFRGMGKLMQTDYEFPIRGISADYALLRPGVFSDTLPYVHRFMADRDNIPVVAKNMRDLYTYTPSLVDRVKAFQTVAGLTPDGVIGKRTWAMFLASAMNNPCLLQGFFYAPTPSPEFPVFREPLVFSSRLSKPRFRPATNIVMHWSASPHRERELEDQVIADIQRLVNWAQSTTRTSSTHFMIMRDASVFQMSPLHEYTLHTVGKYDKWAGYVNPVSVGIDFMNAGPLTRKGSKWLDDYGGEYNGPTPVDGHEPITDAQIRTAGWLVAEVARSWCMSRAELPNIPVVLGHRDITRTKPDPGPLCPISWLDACARSRTLLQWPV